MSTVKRTAVLTGITGYETEHHIKDMCNSYGLNCISVQLHQNRGVSKLSGYAKVIFLNDKTVDAKKFSNLTRIDQWDVTESKRVENGLVYQDRRNSVQLNPVQFVHEVDRLDLPNNAKFAKALSRGNVLLSTTSMSRNRMSEIEDDEQPKKLKAPKTKLQREKKKVVEEEEEEEEEKPKKKKEKTPKKEEKKQKPAKDKKEKKADKPKKKIEKKSKK